MKIMEREEAQYLDGKLPRITAEEVLDFHGKLCTCDAFVAECEHERVLRRTGLDEVRAHSPREAGALLYHCSACDEDFIDVPDGVGKPVCHFCGSNIFVDEVRG
jgi:DNA-directed RNA polymerase subunit RPC12/RpoP